MTQRSDTIAKSREQALRGVTLLFFVGSAIVWMRTASSLAQYHSVAYRVLNAAVEKRLCMEKQKLRYFRTPTVTDTAKIFSAETVAAPVA